MLPPAKQRSRKEPVARGISTTITTSDYGPYRLFFGLNWASFVAPHPFEVSTVAAASSASPSSPNSSASRAPRTPEREKAVREESAMLLAAQMPRRSSRSTSAALQRAFLAREIQQLPTGACLPTGDCHVATLWCLHPSTLYTATLTALKKVDGEAVQCATPLATTRQVKFATVDFHAPLDLRDEAPHVLEHGALLFHPEFVQCIVAQGASRLLFYLPPNLLDARTALPFMHAMWYHGLFTLPESVSLSPRDTLLFFLLPNGAERYVLDLTKTPLCEEAAAKRSEEASPAPLVAGAQCKAEGNEGESDRLMFPWRRQSKVRRVINSGAFTVVVRDDAAGVMASLQRAYDYHVVRHESSWLDPTFIRLMGSCCGSGSTSLSSHSHFHGDTRLVCVELVDEAAKEVVAGCCGMAMGRAYHDYTMFTLRQSKDSLGTFLTKLLGEALQACGYTIWYWGFRVDYMADYERHFGAVNMPRREFYDRWCAARDAAPQCAVKTFLREGKGMVPHTAAVV